MSGPLKGIKVIEMAGLGPAPFCAMLLADMGAEVICIDRKNTGGKSTRASEKLNILRRGRRSIALDLKNAAAAELVLKMIEGADILLEGFRPGVMERMGLGPEACHARNPALVYGRMTGWGQTGPLASAAGHDINYIALSGALHSIGAGEQPVPPLNLVGDFGGGAMLLAFGVVCAALEARSSGKGQVVDAAMTDGAALLMSMIYGFKAAGTWNGVRGDNILDGGAHFYGTYRCADDKWIAIGAIEPQFYALLLEKCGIADVAFHPQRERTRWPELKARLASVFLTKTRDEWCALMEGTDVCFAPVLDLDEAPRHPHNRARQTFLDIDEVVQPAPAPRFSRSAAQIASPPPAVGEHTERILADLGFSAEAIAGLREAGAV
jgi:alpha-methylacyl-CoA racemase